MAGDFERIDTTEVLGVAQQLSNLNEQLTQEIQECERLINSLKSGWTGEAAEATTSVFTAFAKSYQENDHQLIENYAKFLRESVAPNWENTESSNTELGNMFS
ncbi:MAG: WXG100 family type VII secretion target [Clostridia bacterium]|nr:WXG100 family type VII secretion target [Clostridia bacterium]